MITTRTIFNRPLITLHELKSNCTNFSKELDEKVESIRAEMHKNAELAVHRGGGLEKPERLSRGREASAQNRKLKPKLIQALNALGRAYQQKGHEDRARFYFDQAKRSK